MLSLHRRISPDGCWVEVWRPSCTSYIIFFFFQAEDGIRDLIVTGVQTCALPICGRLRPAPARHRSLPRPLATPRGIHHAESLVVRRGDGATSDGADRDGAVRHARDRKSVV